jgi:8-amino-7-oxononanoate synthase
MTDYWRKALVRRVQDHTYRTLSFPETGLIDFTSNDYLGLLKNRKDIPLEGFTYADLGSGGSRLLGGNRQATEDLERFLATFHQAESALVFNSGYDANTGLLSTLPHRHDTIIYDEYVHVSMREGIRLADCKAFSFRHNDVDDLKDKLSRASGKVFIATESLFSMDGDSAPLPEMAQLAQQAGAYLIVDEAHAVGVIGTKGVGLVQSLGLAPKIPIRVVTFGKALGTFGAAILCSRRVREVLINYCRSFIYTTALPQVIIKTIKNNYTLLPDMEAERLHLRKLTQLFIHADIPYPTLSGAGAIAGIMVGDSRKCRSLAAYLRRNGMDVRAIVSPSVPKGLERLRICLHAFNTEAEVAQLLREVGEFARSNA